MANSLLRFVSYKELVFWDYYSYFSPLIFTTKYRTVKLGDLIRQRKGSIIINDTEEYKRCKVQLYGKGVVVRDIVKGSEIKTKKQQLCKTDDFLVAEIDAKFGGYGIVPKYLENAVVSSHYFLYEINQTLLDINYFSLILKLDEFAKQVVATGSTNYAAIRPYHVLGYEIPLPDMDTQKRLVQQYNNKTDKAQKLEEEANRLEGSIET